MVPPAENATQCFGRLFYTIPRGPRLLPRRTSRETLIVLVRLAHDELDEINDLVWPFCHVVEILLERELVVADDFGHAFLEVLIENGEPGIHDRAQHLPCRLVMKFDGQFHPRSQ